MKENTPSLKRNAKEKERKYDKNNTKKIDSSNFHERVLEINSMEHFNKQTENIIFMQLIF